MSGIVNIKNKIRIFLRISIRILGAFVLLYITLLIAVQYDKAASCVILPNGYMIGHASTFQWDNDGHVDMVLRDASGKVLIRSDGWIRFHRHATDPGLVILEYGREKKRLEMPGHELMKLIYEPLWPGKKWNEKKKEHPNDTSIFMTGFYHIYLRLWRSAKFKTVSCDTPWFKS